MSKKSSTGKLTAIDHKKQDQLYEKHSKNNVYDYVIIGTGSAALTVGALLANAGHKICMLEAHDIPGGYVHSFRMGEFYFCGQVHYTWGCQPGGEIYEFLRKIGLEKDITFESYDPEGYDHMVMPDGKTVKIPYGYDKLAKNIEAAYPGQGKNIQKFTAILDKIELEMSKFPQRKIHWWEYITKSYQFINLLKYKNKTVQQVFDECNISKEAQAVLIAGAGDWMAPPEDLSIFAYIGLFGGYNKGAFYPTKHFKYYVERLVKFITDHEGCHIYYESEVTKMNLEAEQMTSVETKDGKKFTAQKFICNMDPQTAAKIIGLEKFPPQFRSQLTYPYSSSGTIVYLGLKDIDLTKYGFGKHNTWHLNQWDMNKTWREQTAGNFEKPWVFIATPTLHTDKPGIAPEGCQIMEIETYSDYDYFKNLQQKNYTEYMKKKLELGKRLIDFVEEKYVPNLSKHIVVQVVGTPTTNEDYVLATKGNAYGSNMTPEQMGVKRLKAKTPWGNFFWCNASSGYGGVYGTVATGALLYMNLTGDRYRE